MTYKRGILAFDDFRQSYGLQSSWPTPVDPVILFLAYCFEKGRSANTIVTYVAGINFKNKALGDLKVKESFVVSKILQGCKKELAMKDSRAPITLQNLKKITDSLHYVCYNPSERVLFHSIFTIMYSGLLRISEVAWTSDHCAHFILKSHDVKLDPTSVWVTLRAFKNNQSGKPVTLRIPRSNFLCPVSAIEGYLALRPSVSGPFFRHADKSVVTRYQVASVLSKCSSHAGLVGRFTTHGFRIGGATDLALKNIPDENIKTAGRWSSNAYQSYLRL